MRVGFPASRVDVQPWIAMLLILSVGHGCHADHLDLAGALADRAPVATVRCNPAHRSGPAARTAAGNRPGRARHPGARIQSHGRAGRGTADQPHHPAGGHLARPAHAAGAHPARAGHALGEPDPDLLDRVLRDVDGMNDLIARCLEVSRDFAEKDSVELDLCDLLAGVAMEFASHGCRNSWPQGPRLPPARAPAGAQAHPLQPGRQRTALR